MHTKNSSARVAVRSLGTLLGYLLLLVSLYSLSGRAQQLTRRITRPIFSRAFLKRLDAPAPQAASQKSLQAMESLSKRSAAPL
jgi:hypothetical protein